MLYCRKDWLGGKQSVVQLQNETFRTMIFLEVVCSILLEKLAIEVVWAVVYEPPISDRLQPRSNFVCHVSCVRLLIRFASLANSALKHRNDLHQLGIRPCHQPSGQL
jgi:hypothetical protein